MTFSFGACGSEVEVTADPKVDVAQVSEAARTALAFAPTLWQQLAASLGALALFAGLVRSMLKGREQEQPTGRGGGFLTLSAAGSRRGWRPRSCWRQASSCS